MARTIKKTRESKITRLVRMERSLYSDLNTDPEFDGLTMPGKLRKLRRDSMELKEAKNHIDNLGRKVYGNWAWDPKKKKKYDFM